MHQSQGGTGLQSSSNNNNSINAHSNLIQGANQGRGYNPMNKGGSNGRKGQQALQSSYFNRQALNANYMISASHDGSLRGMGP